MCAMHPKMQSQETSGFMLVYALEGVVGMEHEGERL